MQMIQNNLPSQTNKKLIFKPKPFHALGENTYELSFMLYYLHSNMLLLEKNETSKIDPMAYSKARVYLKSVYIFYRILLDTLATVIEYFYKKNEKISLPSSFHSLFNKQKNGQLPDELSSVIQHKLSWFPALMSRRNDLVHHYQSFLILFQKDQKGKTFLDHTYLNSFKTPNRETLGDIRDYVGFLLKSYQELIDSLLNLFDLKFQDWYGIVRGHNSRTETILEGLPGYMLWWASIYGKYQNCNMQIIDEEREA
ncbi:hypothetical protein C5S39_01575 [Candidatus Methanophagaceae archaeon]|nr:hypothetical protein C5S39_01575 [Methanophagales archaeon]